MICAKKRKLRILSPTQQTFTHPDMRTSFFIADLSVFRISVPAIETAGAALGMQAERLPACGPHIILGRPDRLTANTFAAIFSAHRKPSQ